MIENEGIKIKYGNVAPGAKESFVPYSESVAPFVDLSELQQEGISIPNIGNPGELYNVLLDGNAKIFPDDVESENFGLWSNAISDEKGDFSSPIVLRLESVGKFSSPGFTFTFDTENNAFATRVNIKWYEDEKLLSEREYTPDNAFFFCENSVEFFNAVEMEFYSINMPKNRLRIRVIDYGYGVFFYGQNVLSMKIKQEIDPISSSIAINTADFTLDIPGGVSYNFQERQPVSIYFNNSLLATAFVEKSDRKTRTTWSVSCSDYIDIMDGATFVGDVYDGKNAVELIDEILKAAHVPYSIIGDFSEAVVSGHIGYTTCRDALMQVCFAIGAVVDTSNSADVKIYAVDKTVTQTLPLDRIMQGQSFETKSRVTGVSIASHAYIAVNESEELYSAEKNGTGDGILVVFSEPRHGLSISNGEILESGANYALINAQSGCVLMGKKYEHTMTTKIKKNPQILATDPQNIVDVNSSATLISSANVDRVLERCYNYLTQTTSIKMKIVDGVHKEEAETLFYRYGENVYGEFLYGGEVARANTPRYIYDQPTKVGETVVAQTEFLGDMQGMILSQNYNITGGRILVKDSVLSVEG